MAPDQRPAAVQTVSGRSPGGNIVLFYPGTGVDIPHVNVFTPLSVVLPAAALEAAGFPVTVVDQRVEPRWRERIVQEARWGPLFFGISAMTGPQIRWGLRAAELVRDSNPDLPIVWGGAHPSVLPEQTLSDDRVDIVVDGRGTEAAVGLAQALSNGSRGSVLGEVLRPEEPPSGCRLRQPKIDYYRFEWRRYVTPVANGTSGLAHVASRGCPHRCAYCYNRSVNGSRWWGEPAESVLDDLEHLRALGCRGVLFFDDNFFVNRDRVLAIARGILRKGLDIKIKADCRADYILRYDEAFLRLLKRAGFEVLFIGAESGSDRVLDMIQKDVTVAQVLEANRRLAKVGISPHYSFMAGLPGETERDIYATVGLMRRLKKENPQTLLSAVKGYVPYPGTRIFEKAVEMGFEPPKTLAGWSRFDWNGASRPWLSKREALLVEKATYLTSGIDTQLFENSGLKRNPVVWRLYRFYARICRKRCERRSFGPMPELPLLRLLKHWLSTA